VVVAPPPAESVVVATAEPVEAAEQVEAAPPDAPTPPDSRRGWLGVELEPAPDLGGVRINNVVPRSPAESAGLIIGDVILKIDGDAVPNASSVVAAVQRRRPGAQVGIALKRGRADKLVSLQLGAAPEADELARMTFVDHPAPSFQELRAARGTFSPTLAAQRGQVVILEFWAPWCSACRLLIPHMNDWHAQYAARGLRVIGVTVESVTRAAAAATELGMDYSIASDETGKTTTAYKARAIPAVFAIDRSGNVRDVMIGFDAARLAKFDQLVKRLVAER
jgi:peroxiredoxin